MASILSRTQNGIVFNNIDNTSGTLQLPLKITQSSESLDYKLVDAVNIDWNNAYLPSLGSYINESGDLLTIIDSNLYDMQTQISWETYDGEPTTSAPTTSEPTTTTLAPDE